MKSKFSSTYIRASNSKWTATAIQGVELLALNTDSAHRQGTFLYKMAPNTVYPAHRHPGGEEILVLKGDLTIGDYVMAAGDFLYSPPGTVHEAKTQNGCMYLTLLPKPIEIIGSRSSDELDPSLLS